VELYYFSLGILWKVAFSIPVAARRLHAVLPDVAELLIVLTQR
jgi:hypothetical protein